MITMTVKEGIELIEGIRAYMLKKDPHEQFRLKTKAGTRFSVWIANGFHLTIEEGTSKFELIFDTIVDSRIDKYASLVDGESFRLWIEFAYHLNPIYGSYGTTVSNLTLWLIDDSPDAKGKI